MKTFLRIPALATPFAVLASSAAAFAAGRLLTDLHFLYMSEASADQINGTDAADKLSKVPDSVKQGVSPHAYISRKCAYRSLPADRRGLRQIWGCNGIF